MLFLKNTCCNRTHFLPSDNISSIKAYIHATVKYDENGAAPINSKSFIAEKLKHRTSTAHSYPTYLHAVNAFMKQVFSPNQVGYGWTAAVAGSTKSKPIPNLIPHERLLQWYEQEFEERNYTILLPMDWYHFPMKKRMLAINFVRQEVIAREHVDPSQSDGTHYSNVSFGLLENMPQKGASSSSCPIPQDWSVALKKLKWPCKSLNGFWGLEPYFCRNETPELVHHQKNLDNEPLDSQRQAAIRDFSADYTEKAWKPPKDWEGASGVEVLHPYPKKTNPRNLRNGKLYKEKLPFGDYSSMSLIQEAAAREDLMAHYETRFEGIEHLARDLDPRFIDLPK